MTLIINTITPQNVIQASDRRLTFPDGSRCDDEANKVVCVSCKDGYFAIAYTGLAEIKRQRTDIWIVDYLTAIKAHKMTVKSISESLEKYATSCLKSVDKKNRKTSFLFAGYRLGMPFTALISNFETYKSSGEAQDHFQTYVWRVRGPLRNMKRGLWVDIFGINIFDSEKIKTAVEKSIRRKMQIRKLTRKRFFHKQDALEIAKTLVSFIRMASKMPSVGKYIGRNCMTVIIKPDPQEPIVTEYHPEMKSSVQYLPHVIIGNEKISMSFKNVEIWSEKPPWW